mgnify:CR=1 FL=1
MPRNNTTTTYVVGDVRDRLDDRLDELADRAVHDSEAAVAEEASTVEQRLVGVQWLVDEFGAEAEVTIGGLNTGEYGQLTDRVSDAQAAKVGGSESTTGASRIFFVAFGLVDAPFVDADTDFEATVREVRELPPQTTQWLEHVIDEATVPSDPGNSFSERVQARSRSGNATESPEQH